MKRFPTLDYLTAAPLGVAQQATDRPTQNERGQVASRPGGAGLRPIARSCLPSSARKGHAKCTLRGEVAWRLGLLLALLVLPTGGSAWAQSNLVAWGNNTYGQTTVPGLPPGVTWTQVAAGLNHTVAINSDGDAVAWGSNSTGQTTVPALPPGLTYVEVRAGDEFTVARRSDGSVVTWGWLSGYAVPALPPGLTYVEVAAGRDYAIARRNDGSAVGWGYNNYGQINVPAPPAGLTYVELEAGVHHAIARCSDGSVVGWGANNVGQTSTPALPPGLTYTSVAAGYQFSLASRSDGAVLVWGWGAGSEPLLPPGVTYVDVASGDNHRLARRSDGTLAAWGENGDGQSNVPALPPGLSYVEATGGWQHTVARIGPSASALSFCSGDGSGTPCPCGNSGATGNGCASSVNPAGGHLAVAGFSNLSADSLALNGSGMPNSFALFFQGTTQVSGGLGSVFGDGLRCAGGAVVRLKTVLNASGASLYPQPGDPSVSVRGMVTTQGVRTYQVWYRNAAAFCDPATFNLTNGVRVYWVP